MRNILLTKESLIQELALNVMNLTVIADDGFKAETERAFGHLGAFGLQFPQFLIIGHERQGGWELYGKT